MDNRFISEELIKECLVPLDEIKSKLAIVPIEVLEEVLDGQFLTITNERYLTRLEFRVRELEARVIELESELESERNEKQAF